MDVALGGGGWGVHTPGTDTQRGEVVKKVGRRERKKRVRVVAKLLVRLPEKGQVPDPKMDKPCAGNIVEEKLRDTVHRKKSFSIFPSPAGMSLTKLSLGGNNDVIYKLFPPRESLVSDIPAVDGNIGKLFLRGSITVHPRKKTACLP